MVSPPDYARIFPSSPDSSFPLSHNCDSRCDDPATLCRYTASIKQIAGTMFDQKDVLVLQERLKDIEREMAQIRRDRAQRRLWWQRLLDLRPTSNVRSKPDPFKMAVVSEPIQTVQVKI